uniref:Cytochrome P450 78A3p family protein n=1 Tax=Populus alba TaxID=43335 RepID=A0A4U5QUS2_POPAL|nr:cytochrome P450 78A3p family protein [Populus alba]
MRTDIESFWIFALASKCRAFTQENIAWSLLIIGLAWIVVTLIYWAYPGGPAWGKYKLKNTSFTISNAIPGSRGLPVTGSMKLMTSLAHHKIAAAAAACKARRLMAFSLGDTRVIVTCNPDVAKEILNSSVFADRPVKESAYSLMFNRAIGFAPYGVYWRTLRKIASTHLFCPKQIKAAESQRLQIASQMVSTFSDREKSSFSVRGVLKRASLNNMMCSVFGREYKLDSFNNEVEELRALVEEGYDLLGTLNWSDHLPWLADFDPQKIRFRCSNLVPKVNRFVSRIIAEHRALPRSENPDFVDVLLSLQGHDKLSDSDMIAVLWEMIFRGTDTVAVLIEWILARMVLHPDVQSKVHDELYKVVGRSRVVAESDITAMEDALEFSVLGSDLRLAPFGSGRRTCPGKTLGITTVTFWVASLLHEYEWVPGDENNVDLSEVLRLSCEMANPLTVKVRPRRSFHNPPVLGVQRTTS